MTLLLLLPYFEVSEYMEEMATSDPFQLLTYIICSSLSKIKAALFLVTYSSSEASTDTKWNQFWQVIKKCFGMLRAL